MIFNIGLSLANSRDCRVEGRVGVRTGAGRRARASGSRTSDFAFPAGKEKSSHMTKTQWAAFRAAYVCLSKGTLAGIEQVWKNIFPPGCLPICFPE